MVKFNRWAFSLILFLSCPYQSFSYIPELLESNADSFNTIIWSNSPVSLDLVQQRLSFLEDKDEDKISLYANSRVWENYESNKGPVVHETLQVFYSVCKRVFDNHADIDLVTQAAVGMLFERTLEKYTAHEALLEQMHSLLPSSKSVIEETQSVSVMAGKNPIEIPAEYQAQFDLFLAETINNIARNFFPDVDQGKLTLETLSLRCGQQVEFLRQQYNRYHNHNKKESL